MGSANRPFARLARLISSFETAYHSDAGISERLVRRLVLVAVVVGLALRMVLLWASHGSDDMTTWTRFADSIRADGVWQLYRIEKDFNHPPLMGWMAAGLRAMSALSGIPFRILFKVPMLLGDALVVGILWQYWRDTSRVAAAVAIAIFSCNPISVLVTAYHGNTDSLVGALGLAAAFCLHRGHYLRAGLMVAAAGNVKIVGVLWAPGLLLLCPNLRAMARFVAGGALGAVPFALPLFTVPHEFYRNVLSYGSRPRNWGISRLLSEARGPIEPQLSATLELFQRWGRELVIGGIVLWAAFGRLVRLDPFCAAALTMAAFFTLAPGFGVQYLVWIVPVLAAASQRFSLRYALLGGLFAFLVYAAWLTDRWPLMSRHRGIPAPAWVFGLFVWATLIAFQWRVLVEAIRGRGVGRGVSQRLSHTRDVMLEG